VQTADKATVEEFPLPIGWGSASEEERDEELIKQAVIAAVVPGREKNQTMHACLPAGLTPFKLNGVHVWEPDKYCSCQAD
jgi:hypothetical protein